MKIVQSSSSDFRSGLPRRPDSDQNSSMKCLHCGTPVPGSIFEEWGRVEARRGLFRCPACRASHLRELVDRTADGAGIYEFRLWGHPATTRRFTRVELGKSTG